MYLLEEQLIDFVASDIHNDKHITELSDLVLSKNQKILLPKIIEHTKKTFLVS